MLTNVHQTNEYPKNVTSEVEHKDNRIYRNFYRKNVEIFEAPGNFLNPLMVLFPRAC